MVPIHPSAKVTVCWFITEHPRLSLCWKLGRFSVIVSRVYRWQHVTTINIFFYLTWEVGDITMSHCFSCQMNQQMQQAQEMLNLLIPKTAKLSWCFNSIRCLWRNTKAPGTAYQHVKWAFTCHSSQKHLGNKHMPVLLNVCYHLALVSVVLPPPFPETAGPTTPVRIKSFYQVPLLIIIKVAQQKYLEKWRKEGADGWK